MSSPIDPRRLYEFESRWLEHGGGPADQIRSEFGLSVPEFFVTLQNSLEVAPPADVPPARIDRMRAVSRKRLWLER